MATAQVIIHRDSSTVTLFKEWAQQIDTWLQAAGWTLTTDTGQLGGNANWAAVASVPTAATPWYLMYRSPVIAGLTPFYLKYTFGNLSASNTNQPGFYMQIGTGTNGAGTLVQPTVTGTSIGNIANQSSNGGGAVNTYDCRFCYDANGNFVLLMWRDYLANISQFCVAVERSHNGSGVDTDDYATIVDMVGDNNGPSMIQQSLCIAGAGSPFLGQASSWIIALESSAASQTSNSESGISPLVPQIHGFGVPMKFLLSASSVDLTETQIFSSTVLGATHTWFTSGCLSNFQAMKHGAGGQQLNRCMAMLWE